MPMRGKGLLALLVLAGIVGCRATTRAGFLNLIGLSERPLGVMHVGDLDDDGAIIRILNPFESYRTLNHELGAALERQVAPDLCLLFQLEPNLQLGVAELAFLTPVHYVQLNNPEVYRVVATPADREGRLERPALLIAKVDEPIQSVADLRGRAVGFGRASDARTHYAALALLAAHGVQRSDLALDVLPIPGKLRHYARPEHAAAAVRDGAVAAAFVDIAWWDSLPAAAGADAPFGQDQFQVVERTAAVPQRLVIAGPTMDQATFAQVQTFLVTLADKHPEAIEPLGIGGYRIPTDEQVAAWIERLGNAKPEAASPEAAKPQ